jgi:hypothetical protein
MDAKYTIWFLFGSKTQVLAVDSSYEDPHRCIRDENKMLRNEKAFEKLMISMIRSFLSSIAFSVQMYNH